ncbi:hypothetical protein [Clostridium sp. FP1]|uniref:hypothetical protein n=1 Tax=Clostridium sp. FP1 TaxID=2724076 RepID=UPI0013E927F6|nr:hypothetical protein [Clostridium sp. FP1]MBZ9633302.1 ABC transporter permease [Clostridium sp. FP1]
MRLIIWEVRKLFFSKRTIIATLAILIIGLTSGILDGYHFHKQVEDVVVYNEMVKPYEGKTDKNLEEDSTSAYYADSKLKPEERRSLTFKNEYARSIYLADLYNNKIEKNPDYKSTVSYLSNLCSTLEKKDTYLYKDSSKNLEMISSIGEPGYYNNMGWQLVYIFLTSRKGISLMLIAIIIAITPIFSEENENNMERIILCTKMGRGKFVSAKIATSFMFVILWTTIYYACNTLVRLIPYKNLSFTNIPLNSIRGYGFTPFKFTVLQGLGFSYITTLLSAVALVAVFCAISAWQKNSIVSLALGLGISFGVLLISGNKIIALWPSITITSRDLFSDYSSYNIFNNPVLYPIVAVVVLMIILIIGVLFTYKNFYGKIKS